MGTGFAFLSDMMFQDEDLVAHAQRSGLKRFLLAGNGISTEAQALASAGFDVTAMDLSALALDVAAKVAPNPEQVSKMVGAGAARAGGTAQFVVGDILDVAACPGPFDVIIERRTAQGYYDNGIDGFLSALAARLSPNGVFVSHCHDGRWKPGAKPFHASEAWFRAQGWRIVTGGGSVPATGRTGWLVRSTG